MFIEVNKISREDKIIGRDVINPLDIFSFRNWKSDGVDKTIIYWEDAAKRNKLIIAGKAETLLEQVNKVIPLFIAVNVMKKDSVVGIHCIKPQSIKSYRDWRLRNGLIGGTIIYLRPLTNNETPTLVVKETVDDIKRMLNSHAIQG